jgi:hypothetical protein
LCLSTPPAPGGVKSRYPKAGTQRLTRKVVPKKVFPKTAEGYEAETNYELSTQLPYMMIMNRLAHYVKVLQREDIGS